MSTPADGCGPHCPDTFPHNHFYSGHANPTRLPAGLEAAMQARPTISDEQYLEERLGPRPTLDTWLTTFEAADIAGVSRSYLLGLLDAGDIPFERMGRHRRILCRNLVAYLRADDARRERAADELGRLGQQIEAEPLHTPGPGGHGTVEARDPEAVTAVPSEYFGQLADDDAEPRPNEATRDAFRRLGETVERR